MTREEAIEYLIRCADGLDPDFECAISMAVSALRAQQTSGWISVKDRLPKTDGTYLVATCNGGVTMSHWYKKINSDGGAFGGTQIARLITHWRPMPELPQKGE